MERVPPLRIRRINDAELSERGEYVLYWMTAFRRLRFNFSLQRAVEWAKELNKPLVILEALRCDYRWASDRLHHFVMQGMADNAELSSRRRAALYCSYLEPEKGAGKGLFREFASRACVVVGDDFPAFFLPRMMRAAARQSPVAMELVDSNGLLPLRAADKVFARAYDLRRFLQKNLLPHLAETPEEDPLAHQKLPHLQRLPKAVRERWPMTDPAEALASREFLANLPIDHAVAPAMTGGAKAGADTLKAFIQDRLGRYDADRNQPEEEATSGLSAYLHFGHVSAHEAFDAVVDTTGWTPENVSSKSDGSSRGWWGLDENAESFLDELITWRELGYNMCALRGDYDQYESLPAWAQQTLEEHATDPRPHVYSLEEFENAATHDELWNAAQRQLVRDGIIHNYLRMLWGKKIIHWTESPRVALDVMVHLNNKYAVDGRDPNSYSGIFWTLGRYDRPWGPERPVFGKVRYMSCDNTHRKLRVSQYIDKYSANSDRRLPGFD